MTLIHSKAFRLLEDTVRAAGAATERLQRRPGERVSSFDPGPKVERSIAGGEPAWPLEFAIGAGVFLGQGGWQIEPTASLSDVAIVRTTAIRAFDGSIHDRGRRVTGSF